MRNEEKEIVKCRPMQRNLHSEFFDCQCISCEHTLRFMYFEEELETEKHISQTANLYLTIQLDKYPWYKRIWMGIKYIFGYRCKYGYYNEWIMHPDDIPRLKALLDKFEKFYEENPDRAPKGENDE